MLLGGILALSFLSAQAGEAAGRVSVSNAYARAVPPGQPNGAVFMDLINAGAQAHALVAAQSPVAKSVELHSHDMEGGMMRMRRIERVALPAGATVQFAPGGLHVMLIGLERQLRAGEQVPLTLIFEDGSRVSSNVEVRPVEPPTGRGGRAGCGGSPCGSGE